MRNESIIITPSGRKADNDMVVGGLEAEILDHLSAEGVDTFDNICLAVDEYRSKVDPAIQSLLRKDFIEIAQPPSGGVKITNNL